MYFQSKFFEKFYYFPFQSLVVKAQKTFTDHTEFVKTQMEFQTWLSKNQGTVHDCQSDIGTEEQVCFKEDLL